ncbi:hypothetical protein IFM89_026163 [Coptis chinensis]|uniref:Uncharacterized protein n=1 Tax=Coptis chinensis TaxID=261450 RepID=A0A835LGJ6_9MAGN|nr:hypothetical protein IFM89_026163 [Coptis chinensis]
MRFTDLSLHYLSKAKILVVKDVERDDIEFITKTQLNCLPIANIEHFREEKMGRLDCVEEKFLIAGGGVAGNRVSRRLGAWAKVLHGMESYCVRSFAEALEVIPYTLAENASRRVHKEMLLLERWVEAWRGQVSWRGRESGVELLGLKMPRTS